MWCVFSMWGYWLYCDFCIIFVVFFFFKQKTAYEMLRSLVGSEMCIRDSVYAGQRSGFEVVDGFANGVAITIEIHGDARCLESVSYTHLTLPTIYPV